MAGGAWRGAPAGPALLSDAQAHEELSALSAKAELALPAGPLPAEEHPYRGAVSLLRAGLDRSWPDAVKEQARSALRELEEREASAVEPVFAGALEQARAARAAWDWPAARDALARALAFRPTAAEALALTRELDEKEETAKAYASLWLKVSAALPRTPPPEEHPYREALALANQARQAAGAGAGADSAARLEAADAVRSEVAQLEAQAVRRAHDDLVASARHGMEARAWDAARADVVRALAFLPGSAEAQGLLAEVDRLTVQAGRPGWGTGLSFAGTGAEGLREYRHDVTGIVLVLLSPPPTEVLLGSPEREEGAEPGERRRRVRLTRPFLLGKTEVTNEQYRRFRPGHASGVWQGQTLNDDAQPAVGMRWDEAAAFCRWAGLRLPTEAEWEYAARGGDEREFPWGNEWPPPKGSGNYSDESARRGFGETAVLSGYDDGAPVAAPAGRFLPNPFGLFDLGGNVLEWCWDWYGEPPSPEPAVDPAGPACGDHRVLRGGSWRDLSRARMRCGRRGHASPGLRDVHIGFRVALTADDAEPAEAEGKRGK